MIDHDFLQLGGKTIVVTGATSGIGRETALRASRHGATVALVARRVDALHEVLSKLEGDGHIAVAYDLVESDGIPAMLRRVADQLGGLDGLVHAAGMHRTTPLKAIQATSVRELFDINVTTSVMLAKGFRHKQVRREHSSLVFLASAVGLVGQPGVSIYSATKGAIVSLTRSLALELAREGVRVNCICPGVVHTPMTDGLAKAIGPTAFDRVADAHPLGLGDASDVANAALYLLSTSSKWVTGSALTVDGGYTAQ